MAGNTSHGSPVHAAYDSLLAAMGKHAPALLTELRPPVDFSVEWTEAPGAEQVLALWSRTSGQTPGSLGALGGLTLLEPSTAKWSVGSGQSFSMAPDWMPLRVPSGTTRHLAS